MALLQLESCNWPQLQLRQQVHAPSPLTLHRAKRAANTEYSCRISCHPLAISSCRLVDEIVWVKMTVNRRLAKSHGFYLQHAKEASGLWGRSIAGSQKGDPLPAGMIATYRLLPLAQCPACVPSSCCFDSLPTHPGTFGQVCLVARKGEDPPGMQSGVGSDVIYRRAANCCTGLCCTGLCCSACALASLLRHCVPATASGKPRPGCPLFCLVNQVLPCCSLTCVQRAERAEPEAGGNLPADREAGAERCVLQPRCEQRLHPRCLWCAQ